MTMKRPKRVGVYVQSYDQKFRLGDEVHPFYYYRGYYIAREYSRANSPGYEHFVIFRKWISGKPFEYDFDLNQERGQKTLKECAAIIDVYLEEIGRLRKP